MTKTELKQPKIVAKIKREHLTMTVDREEFAIALKTWRLRNDLTQQQVADRWNLSRWTILRIEQAKDISWPTAYKCFARLSAELQQEGR